MKDTKNKVFVGNIPFDITKEELESFFGQIGPFKEISLPEDRNGKNRSGYAFCLYNSRDLAKSAIRNLDQTELKKRIV